MPKNYLFHSLAILATSVAHAQTAVNWSPSAAQLTTLNSGGTLTNIDTGINNSLGADILMNIATSAIGGTLNIDSAALANNQFDNRRASVNDLTGNSWKISFSESVDFLVSSEEHSFFGDNEIITVSSTSSLLGRIHDIAPLTTLEDSTLRSGLIGSSITGDGTTNQVIFRGNLASDADVTTVTGKTLAGSYWEASGTSNEVTIAYHRESEPATGFARGREPFTVAIYETVPEPSSSALLGLGALGLLLRRKRG